MKKKDLPVLLIVIGVSALISFFVSGALFGSPETEPQEAEVVEAITDEFSELDDDYYNDKSINPTQLIRIGDEEGNVSPFGQSD